MREASPEEAKGRMLPDWIVWVVSTDKNGKPNVMPAGWCMFTSMDPSMVAVSIGKSKYTCEMLGNSDDFVVAFPSEVQK